jgi:hypothetical protein
MHFLISKRPSGTWTAAHILGTMKEEWRFLEMGHMSPRELYEGNLEGWILCWGLKDMLSKTLEMGICFYRAFGEHGGTFLS